MKKQQLYILLFSAFGAMWTTLLANDNGGKNLADPYKLELVSAIQDTMPLQERFGNSVFDENNNPFDLNDPSEITKEVEYDVETGQYIVTEKIGEEYYRMPTYMTFDEYMDYKAKEQEKDYFNQLSGLSNGGLSGDDLLDPINKLDIEENMLDRLFGGTGVSIDPQGNIDLTFGFDRQNIQNPILTERQRRTGGFDFDMAIQMSVDGKIGEKLRLGTNYNTQATFDFENQMKLAYDSHEFSEDEIIKTIEAGNVSLPLRTNLIQGSTSLFGIKVGTQFGRLWLTAIASQQKSRREQLQIQGGSQIQEFEAFADQYDENRHFFLSFFNRNNYEPALANLPQINSQMQITRMEVWITNDRNVTEGVREIVAFADIGEGDENRLTNSNIQVNAGARKDLCQQNVLPDNAANELYAKLQNSNSTRFLDKAVSTLQGPTFQMQQSRDFEKVRARLLTGSEYSYHPTLGFVSVNVNLRPDQVLGVSYEYTYNGEVFSVGEFTNDNPNNPDTLSVLYTKMLKSTTQRVDLPAWDLMMKNIYGIGAFQVNKEDFKLDVFYEDPGQGEKRFLPESNLQGTPLIRIFNLDNLNSQGDPLPDGVFDFVEGVSIDTRGGRIIFPVLEPFGSSLANQIDDPDLAEKYTYQMLYDSTVTRAREFPEFNRFKIKGTYKSSVSSEIQLGAFNLPQGSVKVTAGAQELQEGIDYEVDYNIGRLKILNDAILNSGVPVNVSFEDNTLFGFQTKTMLGLRADYRFSEDVAIGGTYMHLFERPFTQKVNIGDDPINNKIIGLDVSINKNAPWLTKAVDRLPLIETKAESSVSFVAEGAILKPGHSKAINQGDEKTGSVYLDDFEGSASSFDLRTPSNAWFLASVPQNDEANNNPMFPESEFIDTTLTGVNRALLNWYRIDPTVYQGLEDNLANSYSARILQEEVFPNLQITPGQTNNIQSLDLTYYPDRRGPYNFDMPNGGTSVSKGLTPSGNLDEPGTRWGGIMRALNSNNFEAANIEYLEFWVLSPFIAEAKQGQRPDNGKLYIELGNISEDILRDSRKSFENGLPTNSDSDDRPFDNTSWGRIPRVPPITNAFDNDPEKRRAQDVGLDGINDAQEQQQFKEILDVYQSSITNPTALQEIMADPSNDNFLYFNSDEAVNAAGSDRLARYSKFNNSEGNSRPNDSNTPLSSGTNIPDSEDLNRDNTLSETESYFQYEIDLTSAGDNIAETNFLTESRTTPVGRTWHRFKIPLDQFTAKVGGIQDFRSIRFIRMYLKDFDQEVTLRFARFELVRNQWRRYRRNLRGLSVGPTPPDGSTGTLFDVNAVNIEQNSSKAPFNYVLPPNIRREQSLGAFPNVLQNEQSLSLEVCGLQDGDARAIFKNINLDMRVFDELRMFVHAESEDILNEGDMNMFIRIGSDYEENYYEYEIPLTMSDESALPDANADEDYREEVWRQENELSFKMSLFKDLKVERNNAGAVATQAYESFDPTKPENKIRVKGNPNLGLVKGVMIGVRNREDDGAPHCAEVWVNELRVNGFDERGGGAALARLDMQFADFGSGSVSANYSSIGWGSLEQKVAQRQREQITQFDAATNLELGKLLPEESGIKIPFYASYSTTIKTPEYDPYDLDIKLKDNLDAASTVQERDSLRKQAEDFTSIKSINFTNVRKERTSDGKPFPWDISNFSATYAHTETEKRDPIIERNKIDQYRGALNYTYSMKPLYITPFKKIIKGEKLGKQLGLIKEANFNIVPNTFSFNTALDRTHAETKYRFADDDEFYNTFYDKRFTWDRNYTLSWDLTKALKLNFNAANLAVIDELSTFVIDENNPAFGTRRSQSELDEELKTNLRDFGRTKSYNHNVSVSYTVPTKNIPIIDWVGLRAQYGTDYSWNAAAINVDSLGNVIANSQNRQASADLNFEKLYNKSKYLKAINSKKKKGKGKKSGRLQDVSKADKKQPSKEDEDGKKKKKKKTKKARQPTAAERALIRPLMMIRKGKLSYAESYQTVIPGYMPESKFFGSNTGFSAPGWQFISGWQPDRQYLDDAADAGWITDNIFLNQQVVQNYTQNLNGTLSIEPFNSFKIDLEASKSYSKNSTEFFKVTEKVGGDFEHLTPRDVGSMTTSFYALNTLFDNDIIGLFETFEDNRIVISDRLGSGTHALPEESQYSDGYGRYQNEVLIPAFLSAYTKSDPETYPIGFNSLFDYIPKPNWRLSYNGLDKLPGLEDVFSSVRLNHAYRSSMTVNSFNTDLDFDESTPFRKNENTYNFYSKYEIPGLVITEGFTPLIGLDMTFENSMNIRLDWSKSRDLQMSFTDFQLSETKTEEYTISLGYTKEDVFISFLKPKTGPKKQNTKRSKNSLLKKNQDAANDPDGKGKKEESRGSDLNFKFDFSYRDDITINHLLDQNISEPTRGLRTIRISPSIDYDVNENLNVRLYFDYSKTNPKTSASFPITSTQGGLRVRFTLN